MALELLQITIGAAATQVVTTNTPAREAHFEAESNSTHVMKIGPSTVDSSQGISIQYGSPNIPGSKTFGPYPDGPIDLRDYYIAGTAGEKCNITYIPW